MVHFWAVCGCCTRTYIVRKHLEDTLRICDVSAIRVYSSAIRVYSSAIRVYSSPMLCQLSYVVRSVRACDISELSLVPSTTSIPKGRRFDSHRGQAYFQGCLVWILHSEQHHKHLTDLSILHQHRKYHDY